MGATASVDAATDTSKLVTNGPSSLDSMEHTEHSSESSFAPSSSHASSSSMTPSSTEPGRIRSLTSIDQETTLKIQTIILSLSQDSASATVGGSHENAKESLGGFPPTHYSFALQPSCLKQQQELGFLDFRVSDFIDAHTHPSVPFPLLPLRTDGDGDCCLHAVSLSMFGSHDRHRIFRKLLSTLLSSGEVSEILLEAWKQDLIESDLQLLNFGIEMKRTRSAVSREWSSVLEQAAKDREWLGSFHILALAHVIRRPIIVYSDEYIRDHNGSPLSPNDLRGIFLPLALQPEQCSKVPICLAFTTLPGGMSGHFTAMVPVCNLDIMLPINNKDGGGTLPVRYGSGDWVEGIKNVERLYLNIVEHEVSGGAHDNGDDDITAPMDIEKNSNADKKQLFCTYNSQDVIMLPESVAIQQTFLSHVRKTGEADV